MAHIPLTHHLIHAAVHVSKDNGETLDFGRLNLDEVTDEGVEMLASLATGRPLRRLALSHNSLTSLPSSFIVLTRLRYLNLKGNDLREIPAVLGSLQCLEILDLSRNKIRKFPDSPPGRLSSLRVLSLSQNRLRSLPTYLSTFTELKVLKIDYNPIEWPPPDILERQPSLPGPEGEAAEKAWIDGIRTFLRNHVQEGSLSPGVEDTTRRQSSSPSYQIPPSSAFDRPPHSTSESSLAVSSNPHYSTSSTSSHATIQAKPNSDRALSPSLRNPLFSNGLTNEGSRGTHQRHLSKSSQDYTSASPVFSSSSSSSYSTHWVPPSSSSTYASQPQYMHPPQETLPALPAAIHQPYQPRYTHSPSLSTSSRTSNSAHPASYSVFSSSFSRPSHSRNYSNASTSSSLRGVTPSPSFSSTALPVPPMLSTSSSPSASSSSMMLTGVDSVSPISRASTPSSSYGHLAPLAYAPSSGPSGTSSAVSSSSATPRPSRTVYPHSRNGSFNAQPQRLSQILGPKKSLPDLRLNHALIISERQCLTDGVSVNGGGGGGNGMERRLSGNEPVLNGGRKMSDGTLRKLPGNLNLASAGMRGGLGLPSPTSSSSSHHHLPSSHSTRIRQEDESPSSSIENARASYFRRLSTLPASTLPKTIPPSLLVLIDSARGLLFALSQIQSSLRQHALSAIDDRFSNVLARVFVPAADGINTLINALDRFDSISRRSSIPPPRIIRGVVEACWRAVSAFGKVVAVLEIQLQVASSKAASLPFTSSGTFEDLRFTRTLLLMLYGSLAEVANSWKAIVPILEEVRPFLQESGGAVVSEEDIQPSTPVGTLSGLPTGGLAGGGYHRKHIPSISNSTTTRTPISPIPERAESHSPSSSRFESPVMARSASAQPLLGSLQHSPVSAPSPLSLNFMNGAPIPSGQVSLREGKPRRQAGSFSIKDVEEGSRLPPASSTTTSPTSFTTSLPDPTSKLKTLTTVEAPHYPLRSALRNPFSKTSSARSSPVIPHQPFGTAYQGVSPHTGPADTFSADASVASPVHPVEDGPFEPQHQPQAQPLVIQTDLPTLDAQPNPAIFKSSPNGSTVSAEIPKPFSASRSRSGSGSAGFHSTSSSISSSVGSPISPPPVSNRDRALYSHNGFFGGAFGNKTADVVDEGLLVMMEQAVELASDIWGLLEDDLDWAVKSASAAGMNRTSTVIVRPPSKRILELSDLIPIAKSHTRQLHQTIVAPSEQDTLYEDASQFFHTVNRVAKVTKLAFEQDQQDFKRGIKVGLGKLTRLSMESVTLLHVLYTKRPSTSMSRFDDHTHHLLSTPGPSPGMRPLALGRSRSATTGASMFPVPRSAQPHQAHFPKVHPTGRNGRSFQAHRSSGSFGSLMQSAAAS